MAYALTGKGCMLQEIVNALQGVEKDDFILEVEAPILLEVPTDGPLPIELMKDSDIPSPTDPLETVKVKVSQLGGLRRTKNMEKAMVYLLEGDPCRIGRAEDCDVVLMSEGVSRHQCEIHTGGGNWFLTDLGSHNGSYVDKVKATPNERVALEERCQVWLGSFRGVFLSPENFFDLASALAGRETA
ncbi:MAG: FHA domain-containing protein [Planctomycetota bacterium]